MSTDRHVASHHPCVSYVAGVRYHITQQEGCHDIAKCVNLSTDRDVASHHPHVSYVSGVRYHIAKQEGSHDVAERINLSTDRDVAPHKKNVSDITNVSYYVVHIRIISLNVTENINIPGIWQTCVPSTAKLDDVQERSYVGTYL